ncbi:MAG: hypothetical protein C4525_04135 [Desulfarculus sp.]|nr:MAG: hypothetical protein C4525_04135 [Desulfarculus sp.]
MTGVAKASFLVALAFLFAACSAEQEINFKELASKPKAFVGSSTCKKCHLEHYDSWQMTLHSRMTQDAQKNRSAIVTNFDPKKIREGLAKLGGKLAVPADKIFIPTVEQVKYTIGSQWKQRYIIEKGGTLYIAPIQYNVEDGKWAPYHAADWDKRPWLRKCGGCHATGVDLEKQTFVEPSVGCEACHGKGSWHAALPKTAVFQKRETIVNPSKLTPGVAVQICGSCHNRGHSVTVKGVDWPVGYEPGMALTTYFVSTSYSGGDVKHLYANEFSKGHHQQYIDWMQSKHKKEGVRCTSCHYVHQIGISPTRSQTMAAGSNQCLACHKVINNNLAHSIHSFGNCVGCHMPRIAKSAESGDIHSHVFMALLPRDTLNNPKVPNSCQTCHKHQKQDLKELQATYDALARLPKPTGQTIKFVGPR